MGQEIRVHYGSLKAAVQAFQKMEEQIAPRGYRNTSLINESRGQVYEAVNACYEELIELECAFQELTAKTRSLLEQAGIRFVETEKEAGKDFRLLNLRVLQEEIEK